MANYQMPKPPRFRRESVPGGYEFVIPARKNWFVIPFLCVWLTGWTAGGIAAIYAAITDGEPFLYVWLVFWAIGWIFAAAQISYMLIGCEYVRCSGGDLVIGYRSLLLGKSWAYRGSEIRSLAACDGPDMMTRMFGGGWSMSPIYAARRIGTIRFNHGARTIYAGNSLDRAEAELIVTELHRSMPGTA